LTRLAYFNAIESKKRRVVPRLAGRRVVFFLRFLVKLLIFSILHIFRLKKTAFFEKTFKRRRRNNRYIQQTSGVDALRRRLSGLRQGREAV
jgi:hypothetical protein